jgi:hypothetical protein
MAVSFKTRRMNERAPGKRPKQNIFANCKGGKARRDLEFELEIKWGIRQISSVTFHARERDKRKPQGGVPFNSSSARNVSRGKIDRGARPCGVAVIC